MAIPHNVLTSYSEHGKSHMSLVNTIIHTRKDALSSAQILVPLAPCFIYTELEPIAYLLNVREVRFGPSKGAKAAYTSAKKKSGWHQNSVRAPSGIRYPNTHFHPFTHIHSKSLSMLRRRRHMHRQQTSSPTATGPSRSPLGGQREIQIRIEYSIPPLR